MIQSTIITFQNANVDHHKELDGKKEKSGSVTCEASADP